MREKLTITAMMIFVTAIFCILYYFSFENQVTFTQMRQNPEATMEKYKDAWEDTTIITAEYREREFQTGDVVGVLTIPDMEIYELPIYYGSNDENTNWQISTPGYLGNWGMPGDKDITCIGAHNNQLFSNLPELKVGSKFIVETADDIYVYEAVRTDIYVDGEDDFVDVVWKGAYEYSVNLMTCFPINTPDVQDRYIVFSRLQSGTIFPSKEVQ